MERYKASSAPAEPNDKPNDNSPLLGNTDHAIYRQVIGKAKQTRYTSLMLCSYQKRLVRSTFRART
eukprot:9511758-Heterocapsa_arctica.AAC.1